MRCSFAHEIWQIEKSVCTNRHFLCFLIHEIIFVNAHALCCFFLCIAEIIPEPFQRKSCALCNTHNVPCVRYCCTAGVNSALWVDRDRRSVCKYDAWCSDSCERLTVLCNACSDSRSGIVACSAYYYSTLFKSCKLSHFLCDLACYLAWLVHLAQHWHINAKRIADFLWPAAVWHVKKLHTACVGNLCCIFACEDKSQIVLWKKNVSALFIYIRLVVLYPKDFRSRPACEGRVCCYLDELFSA